MMQGQEQLGNQLRVLAKGVFTKNQYFVEVLSQGCYRREEGSDGRGRVWCTGEQLTVAEMATGRNRGGAGESSRERKEGREGNAYMWVPLPHVIHVTETTHQNRLMANYKRFC